MKTPLINRITACCLALAAGVIASPADSLSWDPGSTGGSGGSGTWNLNNAVNWYGSSGDVKWLDNTALGTNSAIFSGAAGTVTLGSSLSASNLQFTTSGYTLSGASTLKLGSGGIDASALSSGTTTLSMPLSLVGGQQMWQAGSGSTLAVNSTVGRTTGAAVDFSATGVTSTSLANDSTGILGPWATVGASSGSTTGDWAANDGSGNIIAYTGYTTVSGTVSSGLASANWANSAALTVSANTTVNSLKQQFDVTVASGTTLTLNSGGLIMYGVSRWLIAGSATTSYLTSGSSIGEFFIHTPNSGATDYRIWPIIKDNGATPVKVFKDGAGFTALANNYNTYSGGTWVNGGVLAYSAVITAPATISPFGTGNVTVNTAELRLGTSVSSASGTYNYTNSITLNGGIINELDGFHHILGNLSVGSLGGALGSTFDGSNDPLNGGFAKGFFIEGLLTGSGPLTVQDSGLETVNAWDSSTVYFTSQGTAAQNTYSGTVTVNNFAHGGSYLYLVGTNALANATINLTGDNSATTGRFGVPTLLFGSGTNLDGVGYATIGGLSGSGSLVLANTLVSKSGTITSSYSRGAALALTVGNNNTSQTYSGVMSGAGSLTKVGTGTLTLSGVNTYTGNTVINGGTLALSGAWISSTNITVAPKATLDVSGLGTITLGASQTLYGAGTNIGSITTTAGTKIYAGTDGGYATNCFNNDLTLASGVNAYMDVGATVSGANDLITVAGTLTANNNIIHLKAPSTSTTLQAADRVLFSSSALSGAFAASPVWDVAPVNAGNFSIITSGNNIVLHYAASTAPTGGAVATPSTALRNQNVLLTVTITNGSGGTVNSVMVDASAIGGSSSVALVSAGGKLWTNTVTVTPDTLAGAKTLVATFSDTVPLSGIVSFPLTVVVGNDVWNGAGADSFSDTALNWTNKLAPGYVGDSLEFAGTTRLAPSLDQSYMITGLTFDSGAGSFNLGTANGSMLVLTNTVGITNNSANAQTVSAVIDGGSLIKAGSGTVRLAGANDYTGSTTIAGGTLDVTTGGAINNSSTAEVGQVTLGTVPGVPSILKVSGGTVNALVGSTGSAWAGFMVAGSVTNTIADIQLTSGALNAARHLILGDATGAYGALTMSGGTLSVGSYFIIGFAGGEGVYNQSGGAATQVSASGNGSTLVASGGGVVGVMNVSGGTFDASTTGIYLPENGACKGILNISGTGSVTVGGVGLKFGNDGSASSGTLNLLGGGTLTVDTIVRGNASAGTAVFNFNGGTLTASGVSATFMTNLSGAYVYGGGAIIDDGGFGVTIAQALLAPSGYGVVSIPVTSGGSGYIDTPIVLVTNISATGSGATAVANVSGGVITSITVTCSGQGYGSADTLGVSLSGGGGSGAVIGSPVLAAVTSGGLTKLDTGILTLSGTSTYIGSTVISNGTLALTGSLSSTNIITASGATYDVSGITYTLGANQSLSGSGNVNGSVTTSAGSKIYGGTDGTYGINTFNNDLTLVAGALCNLDVSTSASGANDQLVVNGTLTANGNVIHLKAPSTSSSLDTTADYVLITSANAISGVFASAPVWDVAPVNAGHYSVVTSGNTVTLHYSATASGPTLTAVANPSTVLRNQLTKITAKVTAGTSAISTVTVDLSPLGGSTISLVRSNTSTLYTNTVTVPASATAGTVGLTVTATDTASLSGSASVSLTIITSTEVWSGGGANQSWSTNQNWVSGAAPGWTGDAIAFAGSTGLAPNMDTNYTITGLAFNSGAGSFTLGTANASTLTVTANGVVNNSANAQTVNVPLVLTAAETLNAASGNLTLSSNLDNGGNLLTASGAHNITLNGALIGSGNLVKTGTGTLTLSAANTFTGTTSVKAGTLSVTAGDLPSPTAAGAGLIVGDTGSAVLSVSGGTVEGNTSDGEFAAGIVVGNVSSGAGAVAVSGTGSVTSARQIVLGSASGSYGAWNQSGGTATTGATTGGFLVVGASSASAVFNQSGGSFTIGFNAGTIAAGDSNSLGVVNLSGGTFTSVATGGSYSTGGGLAVGEFGTGVLNVSGTASVTLSGNFHLTLGKGNATARGTVNLLGGTLSTTQVSPGSGSGVFNFNGGTLLAGGASTSFLTGLTGAYDYSGGAVIDDGGFAITIGQPLLAPTGYGVVSIPVSSGGSGYIGQPVVTLTNISASGSGATAVANVSGGVITSITVTCPGHGYTSSDVLGVSLTGGGGSGAVIGTPVLAANTSGGLTKQGSGTLTLSGTNTYTGNTTVNAGTLELTQPSVATNSTVVVNGAALKLSYTGTNRIAGLTVNGTAQPAGLYNSTTAPAYITGAGNLLIVSTIPTSPTNITFSVTGNTLHLSWPANYQGWTLQVQTNSLTKGLGTNWVDVPGSSSIISTNITVDPTKPTVFYRLRY